MGEEYLIGTIYFFKDLGKYLLAVITNDGEEQIIGTHDCNIFGKDKKYLLFNSIYSEIFDDYNPLDNDSTKVVGSVSSETSKSIDQTVLDWIPMLDQSRLMIDATIYENPITLILPPNFEKMYACFKTNVFSVN